MYLDLARKPKYLDTHGHTVHANTIQKGQGSNQQISDLLAVERYRSTGHLVLGAVIRLIITLI